MDQGMVMTDEIQMGEPLTQERVDELEGKAQLRWRMPGGYERVAVLDGDALAVLAWNGCPPELRLWLAESARIFRAGEGEP